ncbi:MAG: hypothetical protein Q8P13_01245 [bacterium]|nr:hypothetical protein [bacterium]
MKALARFCLTISIFTSLLLFLPSLVEAFTSTSATYNLEGEFGIFGGSKSSANYNLSDTGGGFAPGQSISTNYTACSGFQCVGAQIPSITSVLSSTTINLGTLSTGSVSTQSNTVTVTTNMQGYNLTVIQDGNLRTSVGDDINPVAASPIIAGTEAYGLATSNSSAGLDFPVDAGCVNHNAAAVTTSAKLIAKAVGPTSSSGEVNTICYHASKAGLTPAGSYSQIVTFITTGSF